MASKKTIYTKAGTLLWFLAAIFALLPSWPHAYYRLAPNASESLASTIGNTLSQNNLPLSTAPKPTTNPQATPTQVLEPKKSTPLPEVDPSLPDQNGLIIESIGVKGQLHEGEDWQSILRQGIWRVPDFATPLSAMERDTVSPSPIILAAHRWGYSDWSSGFRKLNSFYNLPKLKVGDKIQIIWEQRQFEYEVYSVQTGTQIPEYNADLILYTCQLWNSPVRFFVMANRKN